MENKEVFLITLVLAVIFALLSLITDPTITGSTVKEVNALSMNFSVITIVLITIIAISFLIEIYKFKIKNKWF